MKTEESATTIGERKGSFRVFLSSTYLDNEDRRRTVEDAVLRLNMVPVGMERFTASAQPTVEECLRLVRESDVFVGILSRRYGWIPDGSDISITEMEYNEARRVGLPCLMLMLDAAVPYSDNDLDIGRDRWKKQDRLDAFKDRASSDQMPAVFKDTTLGTVVIDSLRHWAGQRDAGAAERPTPEPPDLEAQIAKYLTKGTALYETVSLAGFETRVRVPIRLEDLYVPLDAIIDLQTRARDDAAKSRDKVASHMDSEADRAVPLAEAFVYAKRFGNRRGIAILGDPGSGKTTQLKRLFLAVAKEGPEKWGLPEGTVPVFLPLRKLKDTKGNLRTFVESELSDPALDLPGDFGRRLFERGKLLLLFDGLDEVIDVRMRAQVSRWIEKARITAPDSFFAVTCRYAGYTDKARLDEHFLEMHLRPLNQEQARNFVHNWFRIVETTVAVDKDQARIRAAQLADELLGDLNKSEFRAASRVFSMTRNPLLLTTICLVHRDRGELPRQRAQLYDECVNVLLERWHTAKGLSVRIRAESARRILQPVALWMHREQGRTRATSAELSPVIAPVLGRVRQAMPTAEDFLRSVRDESGLLTGWSGDEYGFMHLGFQEYLAAREIRTRSFEGEGDELKQLARVFGQSWWQEVALLLVALEEPSVFERFMRYVVETPAFVANTNLVRQCLDEAAEISLAPFIELAGRAPGKNAKLWKSQLAALRIVDTWDRKAAQKLMEGMRGHPSVEIQDWLKGRTTAAAKETIKPQPSGLALVRIPGGGFLMGSSEHDDDEKPPHQVQIAEFYMNRYPVTNEEYGRFLEANPGVREPRYWGESKYNEPRQPVVGVSWNDAQAYCKWAGLRLPTEAEWEYACRAGTTTEYYSGNEESGLDKVAWYGKNAQGRLHPVGEKEPNSFGLYDMHGNVWEWVEDKWRENYEGAPGDGSAWMEGSDERRVLRGGSWYGDAPDYLRAAYRYWADATFWFYFIGFRCSRDVK